MKLNSIEVNSEIIAELVSDNIEIAKAQDAIDLMADCSSLKARKVIIHERNIIPDFFDLKTRIAGDILQKFVNYYFKVAIVGDFSKYESNTLKDFIYESNRQGEISFVSSLEEAKEGLAK
jgi:hypothetical protein